MPADLRGITVTSKEINVRVTADREPVSSTGDAFFEVKLDGVSVGSDGRIGEEGKGGEYLKRVASIQMILMAATAIGWGDRVIEQAVEHGTVSSDWMRNDEDLVSLRGSSRYAALLKRVVEQEQATTADA